MSSAPVDVLLVSGTRHLPAFRDGLCRPLVLSDTALRSCPPGYRYAFHRLDHSALGGVTDWTGTFHIYAPLHPMALETGGVGVPQFLDSVTDTMVREGRDLPLSDLAAASFDPRRDRMPWSWLRAGGPPLPLRCVFSSTGWRKRHLKTDELFRAADVSPSDLPGMSLADRLSFVQTVHVPVKALAHLARGLAVWASRKQHPVEQCELAVPRSVAGQTETAPTSFPRTSRVNETCDPSPMDIHDDSRVRAAKEDDSEIPFWLWDDRVARKCWDLRDARDLDSGQRRFMEALRKLMHRYWVDSVRVSWWKYWGAHKERLGEMDPVHWKCIGRAGMRAVAYASQSTFWEWQEGSGLFFWRWPTEYQIEAALGMAPMWVNAPPNYRLPQSRLGSEAVKDKLTEKLSKLRRRAYVQPGHADSHLNFFAVPKGDNDIRTVFDGTKSGLNDALYAPWFPLPTIQSMTRCLLPNYYCADNDVGEQFYNFPLHPELQRYSGVDLTQLYQDEPPTSGKLLVEVWTRLVMGQKPSPYQAVRDNRRAKFLVTHPMHRGNDIFAWTRVDLNLPGSRQYRPSEPWISRRDHNGQIVPEVLDYVDDNRTTGSTQEIAWLASSHLAKGYSYLGIQDATRKRRPATKAPGPWAGAVVVTDEDQVYVSVSQERWDKTKTKIATIREEWTRDHEDGPTSVGMDRKLLESCRGFLVYVSRAYTSMRPFLKGLHLTIDGWRPDRDKEGWRCKHLKERWLDQHDGLDPTYPDQPTLVRPVPRLKSDLTVLERLTAASQPPQCPVRPKRCAMAYYGFGDASGAGFGMALWEPEAGLEVQFGTWKEEISARPSNFREALNFVQFLEEKVAAGELHGGTELFMFTDNFVTESVFYRGDARSPDLFNLVLRLRLLEMNHGLFVHIIWISGTRMIAQGVDGLSRGNLTTGVMAGDDMLSYVPLHLSALDRASDLHEYVMDLLPEQGPSVWQWLTPDDWFTLPFCQDGLYIWAPPPAVADVAVEKMAEAVHVRPWSIHLFLVPTLMTQRWRRQLSKASDLTVTVPFDEQLLGELSIRSFARNSGIPCRGCQTMVSHASGIVCANFGYARGHWPPCRNAWHATCYTIRKGDEFPTALKSRYDEDEDEADGGLEPLARDVEDRSSEFIRARPGDHLMCPFQCDLCHFRNIVGCDPQETHMQDSELLKTIRRAILDSFWARRPSTVAGNLLEARRHVRICADFGSDAPYATSMPRGPFPLQDNWGMMGACTMLTRSLDSGRNSVTVQYATVRRQQAFLSNYAHTTVLGMTHGTLMSSKDRQFFSASPTHSLFFSRFNYGLHDRMGDVIFRDQALTIEVLMALLACLEETYKAEGMRGKDRFQLAVIGCVVTAGFSAGVRGEELGHCLLKETAEACQQSWSRRRKPHTVMVLQGRFKGEQGVKRHHFLLANVSKSQVLHNELWMNRLFNEYYLVHRVPESQTGPLFRVKPKDSRPITIGELDVWFHRFLKEVQARRPDLISEKVDVEREFSVRRSLRRGSTTHARNRGVPDGVVEINNRWRKQQNARNREASLAMVETYTDALASLPLLLRYSASL